MILSERRRDASRSLKGTVLEFAYACITLGWLLAIITYKLRRKWGIICLHNHFGMLYDLWTRFMPLYKQVSLNIVKSAIKTYPVRVLDVATGTGFVSLSLAKFCEAICGVDISSSMLRIADTKAREAHLTGIEYINGDAENLCLRDGIFDVVTCNFGIFYFPDQTKAIKEISRVLKPGGELVFSTYSEIGSHFLAGQFHSAEEWMNIVQRAGFPFVDIQSYTWLYLIIVARKG